MIRPRAAKRWVNQGVAMLALAFIVGSMIASLWPAPSPAQAAGDFSIKTGYYLGNGVTRTVTGLGFTPEVIIIKSDTAAG